MLKNGQDSFHDYIKIKYSVDEIPIKQQYGLDGVLFVPSASTSSPRWKQDVQNLASQHVEIDDNTSNKAVLIVRINNDVLALTFGYGRSLLKEECIERNFGLKVALSIIDQQKIRSVNTATFEDMVVTSQYQASSHASQEEFDLDRIADIFRGVSGVPREEVYGRAVSGKDVLKVSVFMHITELKEKLQAYTEAYHNEKYKDNNFEWIDNINEVRDGLLRDCLDARLIDLLSNPDERSSVAISPSETIDWENIDGIFVGGAGKQLRIPVQAIGIEQYLDHVNGITIEKLKRHKLMVQSMDDSQFVSSNMYSALVAHVEHEGLKYILCMGSWYQIQNTFFEKVATYVDSLPRDDELLPKCTCTKELDYNSNVVATDDRFCIMDRKLFSAEDAPSSIEACDLYLKDGKFIHVKFKTRSSMLSHLFAQGRVSFQSFVSDGQFRESVINEINQCFGEQVINADRDVRGFDVVYAIVTPKKKDKISDIIPFFSAVTLMQSAKALQTIGVTPTLCIVNQEIPDSNATGIDDDIE